MPSSDSETFTGQPLEEMTLAQKLCELREDRLRIIGLEQSFWQNVRMVGAGYALKRALQKLRLRRRCQLAIALADYRAQVEDDLAAIEEDAAAWVSDGYRERRLVDEVQRVVDVFGRDADPRSVADLRRYLKLHQAEIASQVRQLRLDELHPEAGARRSAGHVRNWLSDHWLGVSSALLAIVLGGGGWGVAYGIMRHMSRNRPVNIVGDIVDSDHSGVHAARLVNDAAMNGNRLVNVYLTDELGSDPDWLLSTQRSMLRLLAQTAEGLAAARESTGRATPVVTRLVRAGRGTFGAWHHSSYESGHWEETCSTYTDSEGNTQESCTETYVCDYVDHTWTFDHAKAELAIEAFIAAAPDVEPVAPVAIDIPALDKEVRAHVARGVEFPSLEPKEQQELLKRSTDWLRSVSIVGNNELRAQLFVTRAAATTGVGVWIRDSLHTFPAHSEDRDYGCGGGNPPFGYRQCSGLGDTAIALDEAHGDLTKRLGQAWVLRARYVEQLEGLNQQLGAGAEPDDLHAAYEDMGETAILLHKTLNPKSDYKLLSRGWRIAIPLIVLFALATLGGLGGFFGLRALSQQAFVRRMIRRGIF